MFANFHVKIYHFNEAVIKALLLLNNVSLVTKTYLITELAMFFDKKYQYFNENLLQV